MVVENTLFSTSVKPKNVEHNASWKITDLRQWPMAIAYDPERRRRAIRAVMELKDLNVTGWCRAAGMSESALRWFLSGRSNAMGDDTYEELAAAAGVPAAVLRGDMPIGKAIPVVGRVGAGAEVFPIDDHEKGAGDDEIDLPPGFDGRRAVAVRVEGDSMYPAYKEGDLLVYQRDGLEDWRDFIGQDVVVKLTDGRTFVKVLKRATKTTATLGSHNAPDIENARVEWAAPVLWVRRSQRLAVARVTAARPKR